MYTYAARRLKRQESNLQKQKMALAVSENRTRYFFKEIKRMNPKCDIAPNVEGLEDGQDRSIANHFAHKYEYQIRQYSDL